MIRFLAPLILATQAHSATMDYTHASDPEPLTISISEDGRPSFSKHGAYIGSKLGCSKYTVAKDIEHDRVQRICEPLSGGVSGIATHQFDESWGLLPGRMQVRTHPQSAEYVGVAQWQSSGLQNRVSGVRFPPPSPTPVPLPAGALLLLSGLGLLFWRRV